MAALHLRGIGLPDAEPIELWIVDGLISFEPVSGAETIVESGWITPGLVDAHCHVGIRYGGGGGETVDGLLEQAKTERDAGVLLLRDAGSPVDTRFIDERLDLPRIIRAGQHIAAPKRYIPGLPVDLDDESQLPAEVVRQARAGVPTGVIMFAHDVGIRRYAELENTITRWTDVTDRGGHFAALEEPQLLIADLTEFFRPLC